MKKNFKYYYESALFISKHLLSEGRMTLDKDGKEMSPEDIAKKMQSALKSNSHKELLKKVRSEHNVKFSW